MQPIPGKYLALLEAERTTNQGSKRKMGKIPNESITASD
jgi:hypothetical protein